MNGSGEQVGTARREHLGVGWKFPLRINADGGFSYSREEEDIREAIWIILGTAPGERQMQPRFGCGIHELVFAPIGTGLLGDVAFHVREALTTWEPRVDVLDVRVEQAPGLESTVLIRVDYRVRSNNAFQNLVYPFYVHEGVGA
jgi:phage baseplate assembly protein W